MKQFRRKIPRLPKRKRDAHKGNYGHVLIVGGSRGMSGAAVLASSSALKSGAGLVTAAVPDCIVDILDARVTCAMTLPLSDTRQGLLATSAFSDLRPHLRRFSSVVIGPGLGYAKGVERMVGNILGLTDVPCVVDADGLNAIQHTRNPFRNCRAPIIITPHPGEMARLTGLSTEEIQANRIPIACDYAKRQHCIVLLKGFGTVIANPEGFTINRTGNPGMATGGTGDVLAGMIGGFLAQGMSPFDAARLGAHLHGLAGDLAAEKLGEWSLTAMDLLKAIPDAIKRHQRASSPLRGS